MSAKIEFFPVDNGDMTLLTLESGRTIMIDINIRVAADDESKVDFIDVANLLKDRLERDAKGRLYVDAFLLTHPDKDHCLGLTKHFHLGPPNAWDEEEDRILIREMWSSPIIFRRKADVDGALCADADAWWEEARRRVKLYKSATIKSSLEDGDLIQILGEDKGNKTDDVTDILVNTNTEITKVCGSIDGTFKAWLLAPQLVNAEQAEQLPGKNHSSTVIRFAIDADDTECAAMFLTGGDAEVENWERIWNRNEKHLDRLTYNILQAPHHCSWRSLSYDSWSEKGEDAKVCVAARNALSQAAKKAFIVASCKEIKDDKDNPPCIRAKQEYLDILEEVDGEFLCTTDECTDDVLLLEIGSDGPTLLKTTKFTSSSGGLLGGAPKKVTKDGGGRYA